MMEVEVQENLSVWLSDIKHFRINRVHLFEKYPKNCINLMMFYWKTKEKLQLLMSLKKVDIHVFENEEQRLAKKYIHKDDVVLEIGARYGSVSVLLMLLGNSQNQVSVEPDERVWSALDKKKSIIIVVLML